MNRYKYIFVALASLFSVFYFEAIQGFAASSKPDGCVTITDIGEHGKKLEKDMISDTLKITRGAVTINSEVKIGTTVQKGDSIEASNKDTWIQIVFRNNHITNINKPREVNIGKEDRTKFVDSGSEARMLVDFNSPSSFKSSSPMHLAVKECGEKTILEVAADLMAIIKGIMDIEIQNEAIYAGINGTNFLIKRSNQGRESLLLVTEGTVTVRSSTSSEERTVREFQLCKSDEKSHLQISTIGLTDVNNETAKFFSKKDIPDIYRNEFMDKVEKDYKIKIGPFTPRATLPPVPHPSPPPVEDSKGYTPPPDPLYGLRIRSIHQLSPPSIAAPEKVYIMRENAKLPVVPGKTFLFAKDQLLSNDPSAAVFLEFVREGTARPDVLYVEPASKSGIDIKLDDFSETQISMSIRGANIYGSLVKSIAFIFDTGSYTVNVNSSCFVLESNEAGFVDISVKCGKGRIRRAIQSNEYHTSSDGEFERISCLPDGTPNVVESDPNKKTFRDLIKDRIASRMAMDRIFFETFLGSSCGPSSPTGLRLIN